MAAQNSKKSTYIMSLAEKIKVSVSLLGVAALTVVAYWAQSPAAPIDGNVFQANIIATEDSTEAPTEPTENSQDLLDFLGVEKDSKMVAAADTTGDAMTDTTSTTSNETNETAEESLRKLLGDAPSKEDIAENADILDTAAVKTAALETPTTNEADTSVQTLPETNSANTNETHKAAASLEAPIRNTNSNFTIGPDGVPQIDFTGTTIGRSSVAAAQSTTLTTSTSAANSSELPGTGGPIAIPALIALAGAGILQRRKKK